MTHKSAFAAIAALLLFTGCASTSHTTAWEYRWITPTRSNFQQELNAAAQQGWELVSAGPDANAAETMSAILRRPKK
jgi:hypothetical protein